LYINELYNAAREGGKKAEDRLFESLSVSFRLFVRQRIRDEQDAYELVQEALMTIARKYREIEIQSSFSAWAYRILEHILLRYYRSKEVRGRAFSSAPDDEVRPASVEPDPTLKSRLLDCLKKVSTTRLRHARVITLHFQGYSTEEICRRLGGITTGNFYVLLSRARSMLELCLEKGEIE
jgi:RNA polymerase sigma factor (sigma-70 family)